MHGTGVSTVTAYTAHREWATRPADERFESVQALYEAARTRRLRTEERCIETVDFGTEAAADDVLALREPTGRSAALTHWSFEQLALIAGAPPKYLRTLPATIASAAINHGLRRHQRDQQMLLADRTAPWIVHAITSPRYARVHHDELANRVLDLMAVHPAWQLPLGYKDGVFGAERVPSGAYLGDRDMFLFLVDGNRDLDDPTDSSRSGLFRGFILRNSDVGAAALTLDVFLFRVVCGNHIIWGFQRVAGFRRRHVGASIQDAWSSSLASVRAALDADPAADRAMLLRATSQEIAPTRDGVAIGRTQTGTLIYANGAADAEKIAWQIHEGLGAPESPVDPELTDLSDFARDTVHPDFQLVELVRRGVAFHYGNMPTLLRSEIERLFTIGKLRFLVCTSTLVEGVNLACRTIVVRGPKKGQSTPMGPHDFWNLAGRAGRWGHDFSGNIVCVDVDRPQLWPGGVPERARYPIKRHTDVVLARRQPMLDYLDARVGLEPAAIDASLEQVAAYLLAWRAREGHLATAPSSQRFEGEYIRALDERLGRLLDGVEVPSRIVARHAGVSAAALQSLLHYFRGRAEDPEELLPSAPESDDAYKRLIAIFHRINNHLYPAFFPAGAIPVHALVTVEWMRGLPLGQIIRRRIAYLEQRKRQYRLAAVIRDTMRDVEEVARFRAPKYLAAYLDVLKFYLEAIGRVDLFPDNLRFDLYLEFGVATQTLLSLIGLGLSRTSAVALNEYLADDRMNEEGVFRWLRSRQWPALDLPAVVKREVAELLERRERLVS